MPSRESDSPSFHQVMKDFKIGRKKLTETLKKIHITELPTEIVEYNLTEVIPPEILERVEHRLSALRVDSIDLYKKHGFSTASEIGQELGLTKASTFRYLNEVDPKWKKKHYPTIAKGQRRVTLLPPETRDKIERYHMLASDRQMLSIWRSMRQRMAYYPLQNHNLEELIKTHGRDLQEIFIERNPVAIEAYRSFSGKLPIPSENDYVEMRKSMQWVQIVHRLLDASDIIHLTETDQKMFEIMKRSARKSLVIMNLTFLDLAIEIAQEITNDYTLVIRRRPGRNTIASSYNDIVSYSFQILCDEMENVLESDVPFSKIRETLDKEIRSKIFEKIESS